MADYTWDDLKKFWIGAENWFESELSHWAVLVARATHAERVIANEAAEAAPVDPPADPPADPTPDPIKKGK